MTLTSQTPPAVRAAVRPRRSWLVAAAWVYATATVFATVAWLLVGDTWWSQPVNLTTFWWSLPAVPLLAAALIARRPRLALPLLVPAGLWLWSYGGLFVPSAATAADGELRIATFNTYVHAPDASHVLDLVADADPDVLVLQEVFRDRWEELDARLADAYPTRLWFESDRVGGVAVISRFPMSREPVPVGAAAASSRSTQVVLLDVAGREVQVVPLHLISPCPSCGTSMLERLELEGVVRRAEVGEVLAALRPDLPAIVAGDLNSTERSDPYRRFTAAGFDDPQHAAGSGPGFTWPNSGRLGPLIRIDWVLTRGFTSTGASVRDGGPSDHRPVVVDLRFGASP